MKTAHPINLLRLAASSGVGLLLCVSSISAHAQQRLLAERSEIVFVTKQMGVPVEGRFRSFSADAKISANQPESSTVAMRVDLGSISFAAPEVVQEAKGADWLDTKKFPTAEFRSTAVKSLPDKRLEVTGQLSIRGKAKVVSLPVVMTREGSQTQASGQFVLNRADFGIGGGAWADPSLVANDVTVRFRFHFSDN